MFSSDTVLECPLTEKELLASSVAGAAVFPAVLGLSQVAVLKRLGVSVGSRPLLPALFGGVSVCVAGCVASLAAVKSCLLTQRIVSFKAINGDDHRQQKTVTFSLPELLISTVSSVVIFRGLGGRFTSVVPSSLLRPGAFARDSVPAWRGTKPAVCTEREAIQVLGKKYGCHSCGRRFVVSKYFADHQPPSKLLKPNATYDLDEPSLLQKFYPQCPKCSSKQGMCIANNAAESSTIITHPFSMRLYHLFLPVPFAIAYLKSTANVAPKVPSDKSSERGTNQSEVATQTQTEAKNSSIRNLLAVYDSGISELVETFPLLIVWRKMVGFLASFRNPGDAFHIMLWAFTAFAAFGTL